jgi:hypothetical protein
MVNTSTELMTSTRFWELPQSTGLTEGEWKNAIAEITSHEFDVKLNIVSGLRSFIRAAFGERSVDVLYRAMLISPLARDAVLEQLQSLSRLEIDRRYENPNDTALAVFLLLTLIVDTDLAIIAADLVDRAPQCWYARKIAHKILTPTAIASDNTQDFPLGLPSIRSLATDRLMTMNFTAQLGWNLSQRKAEVISASAL